MTKAEKRIAIIKDVLQRLPERNVATDVYIDNIDVKGLTVKDLDREAQCEIQRIEKCYACALGNMLMSHIRIYDKLKLTDIGLGQGYYFDYYIGGYIKTDYLDQNTFRGLVIKPLSKHFSRLQLAMIEAAFEQKEIVFVNDRYKNIMIKAIDFGKKHKSAKARLRAIMQNMLKNNGIFKP